MKLQSKIIALLLPIVVIPIIVLGVIAYLQINNNYIVNNAKRINILLSQTQDAFDLKIKTVISNIQLFSNAKLLHKYVLSEDEETRYNLLYGPLQRLFSSYQKTYTDYYEIRVILPNAFEDIRQTNISMPNVTEDESQTPFVKAMLAEESNIYVDTKINPDNNEMALFVSNRLVLNDRALSLHGSAKLRGYLSITVNLNFIYEQLKKLEVGHSGFLFITDDKGNILFQSDRKNIDNAFFNQFESKNNNTDIINESLFSKLRATITEEGVGEITENNVTAYAGGKALNDSLYLFAWLPNTELKQLQKSLQQSVFAILLFTLLVTSGLILATLKWFVLKPIYHLEWAAREIGQGNLAIDINARSKDEMGSLANSLQQMSKDLFTSNQQIHYMAYYDALTELPNRAMFKSYLTRLIKEAERKDKKFALLFLDMDNFKRINDTLGHEVGDEMLKHISERLKKIVRVSDRIIHNRHFLDEDVLARFGGDEFIILLNDIENKSGPGRLAQRVLGVMEPKIQLANQEVHTSVSIGITLYPDDARSADELIKNSDIAMYHAKRQGKNNYQYFSTSLTEAVSQRLALENRLRHAIENDELSLVYQPKIGLFNEKIIGVEALLRWHDSEMGFISPVEFIPVAEECGLIVPIGEWVIKQACQQLRRWRDLGYVDLSVAVNVSPIQFSRQDFPSIIDQIIRGIAIPHNKLEIELTESIFLDDEREASSMLASIREMGIEISIDDFGTGYCSLSYLRRFPIDCLKIDRSFINEISESKEGEAVITAIITMAHAMRLKIVAEGVETETQLSFLRNQGCECVQGYYFYKPLQANDIGDLLEQQKKVH